eukprot:GEMP01011468.1.p1 GENE.GEMP01011468.1~~GEMP01011468.1.p1  ORF type:complete len:846 (+),score=69.84 GEMP01011468.1:122-2659(+)
MASSRRQSGGISGMSPRSASACLSIYLTNTGGTRHGLWLDLIVTCMGCIVISLLSYCTSVLPLASLRLAARMQQGYQCLPKWEVCTYSVSFIVLFALGIPVMVVELLGRFNETPSSVLQRYDFIQWSGVLVIMSITTVVTLFFIRSSQESPRSRMLLKSVRVHAYLFITIEFVLACHIWKKHSIKWKGTIGHMHQSVKDMDASIPFELSLQLLAILGCFWYLSRARKLWGLRWGRPEGDERWWVDADEAAMVSTLLSFLLLGIYLPVVLPFPSIEVFLIVIMFVLCFSFTAWIEKSGHVVQTDLHDLCVVTFLQKRNTLVHAILFHAPGVSKTVFDFLLFATMPFSKATPWPYGLHYVNWMDGLEEFSLINERRRVVLTAMIIVYCAWLVVLFGVRLFPVSRPVGNTLTTLSAFLYLPCALTATRLFLRGTQCQDDGTIHWDGRPCDESSLHRTVLIFGMSGTIWLEAAPKSASCAEKICLRHFNSCVKKVRREPGSIKAIVLDGQSLTHFLKKPNDFVDLTRDCESVLCCRVSPDQKGQVVRLIKAWTRQITLAIGDGANDCNMILSAHIGIGIRGEEGLQAFNVCDYGIAQFHFLRTLLFVHGRYAYRRLSITILYIFYKNIVLVIPQFLLGAWSQFSTNMLYLDMLYQMYNILYTGPPIFIFGIFDQDIPRRFCFRFSQLYKLGQQHYYLNTRTILFAGLNGVWHSLVVFLVPFLALTGPTTCLANGESFDIWAVGMIIIIIEVVGANFQLILYSYSINWLSWLSYSFCIGSLVLSVLYLDFVSEPFGSASIGVLRTVASAPLAYVVIITTFTIELGPDVLSHVPVRMLPDTFAAGALDTRS